MPTQRLASESLGFVPYSAAPALTTRAQNTATTWDAVGFVAPASLTVGEVRFFLSARTGTLAAGDISADIYSDSAGTPVASLGGTTTVSGTTAGTWVTFGGLSVAVTAGVQYWIVLKNPSTATGNAAANFPTWQYTSGNALGQVGSVFGSTIYGSLRRTTTDGSTWGAASNLVGGFRVGFSDGSYYGVPVQGIATTGAGTRIDASNEMGVVLTTPANATWNVRGVAVWLGVTGTVTNGLAFRLYAGTTLQGTTYTIPRANVTGGGVGTLLHAYFSAPVAVPGGTVLRATGVMVGGGGDGSNAYYCPSEYVFDPDASSTALMPLGAHKTSYNGSAWDDTATATLPPFALVLDSAGPFAAAGGGNTYAISPTVNRFVGNPEDF